jgi:murein DD-endopeptidase MepM/ murein hydrolase activator NlpD
MRCHSRPLFLFLFLILLVACPPWFSPPQTPGGLITSTRSWGWTLPVPSRAPDEDASLATIIFIGNGVRQFTLDLAVQGLSSDLAEIRLSSLDRSAIKVWHAADVPAGGHLNDVPTVTGSAVRISVGTPKGQPWPKVVVSSVSVQEAPVIDPEKDALVIAPGMVPSETIDTLFPNEQKAAFVKVPLAHEAVDLIAFGAGDVRVADPAGSDFIVGPDIAWDVLALERPDGSSIPPGGMARIPASVASASSALRIAWTPPDARAARMAPDPGHARLTIMTTAAATKLAFPARDRGAFFGHWFGIDHDGSPSPAPTCTDPNKINCALDRLECTAWDGTHGVDRVPLLGTRVPHPSAVCYDTHTGTDFGLRAAQLAQAIGVDVTAAASGTVLFADDVHTDDCFFDPFAGAIGCADVQYKHPFWEELKPGPEVTPNFVAIRQNDGLVALYFHLRQGSVAVIPGQTVRCGQKLGQVGSSGQSAGPHLHFELQSLKASGVLTSLSRDAWEGGDTQPIEPFPDRWMSWSEGSPPATTCPGL